MPMRKITLTMRQSGLVLTLWLCIITAAVLSYGDPKLMELMVTQLVTGPIIGGIFALMRPIQSDSPPK